MKDYMNWTPNLKYYCLKKNVDLIINLLVLLIKKIVCCLGKLRELMSALNIP